MTLILFLLVLMFGALFATLIYLLSCTLHMHPAKRLIVATPFGHIRVIKDGDWLFPWMTRCDVINLWPYHTSARSLRIGDSKIISADFGCFVVIGRETLENDSDYNKIDEALVCRAVMCVGSYGFEAGLNRVVQFAVEKALRQHAKSHTDVRSTTIAVENTVNIQLAPHGTLIYGLDIRCIKRQVDPDKRAKWIKNDFPIIRLAVHHGLLTEAVLQASQLLQEPNECSEDADESMVVTAHQEAVNFLLERHYLTYDEMLNKAISLSRKDLT